ncbi:AEC family transporter [Balneatrix alpica]|uniref:AEC family transporter n=1 Tax=Balneatrix alpica TaxID=75684 RepID=A0ABV5ZCG7_9GAMM|nr:AEC family transporter [Balneatrix alpica]
MSLFHTLLNSLLPIFALIGLGWWARRSQLLSEQALASFNPFILYICLPALMFWSTARVPVSDFAQPAFVAAFMLASLGVGALAAWLGWRYWQLKGADGLLASLNALFGNSVYMGIPLYTLSYGLEGVNLIIIATLLANVVFMGIAISWLSWLCQPGKLNWRALFSRLLLKNPLLLPPLLGMLCSWQNISLPDALISLFELLSQATAPVALFAMGLSLYGQRLRGSLSAIASLSALKLLLHPALAWGLGIAFGLSGLDLTALVLMCALPTGALVSLLAIQYQRLIPISSSVMVFSTLLSLLSLPLWMALLP